MKSLTFVLLVSGLLLAGCDKKAAPTDTQGTKPQKEGKNLPNGDSVPE